MNKGAIVVPVYNEGLGLESFCRTLERNLEVIPSVQWVIIFVNDGSRDNTQDVLISWQCQRNSFQKHVVRFVRNFGHQAAIVAGLQLASSLKVDFAVTMDGDGEHPPEVIQELVSTWRGSGNAIIHTLRKPSQDISVFKRISSESYYRIIQRLTRIEIQPGMADFKLWDGFVLNQVSSHLPEVGSLRVFASWLAPRSARVVYEQRTQNYRRSHYSLKKMFSLAMEGLVHFTPLPLRFVSLLGVFSFFFSMCMIVYAVVVHVRGETVPGWASLSVAIFGTGGVIMIALGIISEYLIRLNFRKQLPTRIYFKDRS